MSTIEAEATIEYGLKVTVELSSINVRLANDKKEERKKRESLRLCGRLINEAMMTMN